MSRPEESFCDHCGLPVGRTGRRSVHDGVERAFCCVGCSIAWRLAGRGGHGGGSESAAYLARIGLGVVLTMIVMLIQWVRYLEPEAAADPSYAAFAPWAQLAAATPVVLFLGVPYLYGAARWLGAGRVGADLLVGLGILAAYGASIATLVRGEADPLFFDTAAGLATLVTVGRWLEAASKERATKDLRAFLSADERPARRLGADGSEEAVAASALAIGDRVRVRPGERIPADGEVVGGRALLDEAALTGEPLPRAVGPGDEVAAPAVPTDGMLEIRVAVPAAEGYLARVGEVLAAARRERAPFERLADRIAAVFVPVVLLVAGAVLVAGLARGEGAEGAALHALSVLVIACPCALGIATPLAVTAALGRLAERGILVRSGAVLSDLPRVRTLAFDKTGTLTEGRPTVAAVEPVDDGDDAADGPALLHLAASVEAASEHPWGQAIVAAHPGKPAPCRDARVRPGRGIEGTVEMAGGEHHVQVGSAAWLGGEADGRVAVAVDGRVRARIRLEDALRPSAAGAVAGLVALDVDVHVLSGDAPTVVEAVARQLGLAPERARGGLLPGEKVEALRALRSAREGPVAFVGDGLNDAPALAAADLGIAVDSGTDLARETASVSLLGEDLGRIPALLRAARRTRRAAAANLAWAFGYNAAGVGWAAFHGLPPVLAAAAMVVSSLFVVGNSARLRATLADDLEAPRQGDRPAVPAPTMPPA